jgi:DNA/RNA endonuclease YhcR with UshA esterase domain
MRRFAFVIAIIGMFVLAMFMGRGNLEIESRENLEQLEINRKVSLSGKVVEERVLYVGTKMFILDNGIELVCECVDSFQGEDVVVEGVVSEFENKKQVNVLKIETFSS